MSVVLQQWRGDNVTRLFVRSNALRTSFCIRDARDLQMPASLLKFSASEALAALGLHRELELLERRSRDWRWLSPSELVAAMQAEAKEISK